MGVDTGRQSGFAICETEESGEEVGFTYLLTTMVVQAQETVIARKSESDYGSCKRTTLEVHQTV
jgi:hypothetical protein